jgi:hypothetical protein
VTTLHEVALLRLAAQRLIGPACESAHGAVSWLTAVQAQDRPGALLSVALRTRARSLASAAAAMDAGDVVRSWPMRGTLHLVAAEDLPWMLEVLASRVVADTAPRRAGLGLTAQQLEHARQLAVGALSGQRRLSRSGLFAIWDEAGLSTPAQRGAHMLSYLAMTGTLVFGPTEGAEQLLVLVDEWIKHPRRLDREEALGELALRYFRSHGPATGADLGRWAKLRAADVRAGVAIARPKLAELDVDGQEHLMDPRTPDRLAGARGDAEGVRLLPGFDELLLGYADRRAQLDPEFADRVVPGGNGVFRPTVVSRGRVVGTWARTGRGARQRFEVAPFAALPDGVASALPGALSALPA